MSQRIFLSSTCLDLVDLRSGLKESLEEMGYEVWASEFADFPVDSNKHPHDVCLRNVERADQYVLIINNRYGAAYDGTAYPKDPPKGDPKRVSVTWYEYLRALECRKPIRVLVRQRIWDQRDVFQAARKKGVDLEDAGLPAELFDFLDFVCSQEKASWIDRFRDFPEARKIVCDWLRQDEAQNARQFEREVRELLLLGSYRALDAEPSGVRYFTAEIEAEVAGRPSFHGGRPRAGVMSRPLVQCRPGCGRDEDGCARRRAGIPVGPRAVLGKL
jgi:hypothetical protein